jgi:hypothetical protein
MWVSEDNTYDLNMNRIFKYSRFFALPNVGFISLTCMFA